MRFRCHCFTLSKTNSPSFHSDVREHRPLSIYVVDDLDDKTLTIRLAPTDVAGRYEAVITYMDDEDKEEAKQRLLSAAVTGIEEINNQFTEATQDDSEEGSGQ